LRWIVSYPDWIDTNQILFDPVNPDHDYTKMRIIIKRWLVISDLQVPYHHEQAVKNVIKLARREKFDEVLCVGDEIDFQTISRWAEKTPLAYQQTITRIVKSVSKYCGISESTAEKCIIIRSNHSDRLYSTLLKTPGLISLPELQYPKFMGFAEMGMTYHKTAYEFYPGWVLCSWRRRQHEPARRHYSSLNLAKKYGKSVIAGHSHRLGMSAYSEAIGSHYRPLYGVEVGNLMDRKKASYIRYGSANWQMGFAILEATGKTLHPTLVPVNKDGSFTALGRHYS
jgi:predicted phosphodiesterase